MGLFSALYIVTASLASFVTQVGYPEHFLRGILMTSLIVYAGKRKWSATTMGVVCGIIFALVVPSPAPYLLPSTITSGLIFDLVLLVTRYYSQVQALSSKLMIAAGISGISESMVALVILTYFSPHTLGSTLNAIEVAWLLDLVLNVVLSVVGAMIAIRLLSKVLNSRVQQSRA